MLTSQQRTEITSVMLLLSIIAAFIWIIRNSQSLLPLLILFFASFVIMVVRALQIYRRAHPREKVKRKELENMDVQKLGPWIKSQLLGQDRSIDEMLKTIDRNIHLFKSQRLLSKFLLAGPTGTGKTYFAEILSQGLYKNEAFLLIPMAQFQQAHNVNHVFEAIIEKLKTHNHFVVLLDEIDRCHSGVREALLHYLDMGEIIIHETGEKFLTPGVIVVATTNAGESYLSSMSVHEALQNSNKFDRAFLARFDGIFAFQKLKDIDLAKVVIKYLKHYFSTHKISVHFMEPEVLLEVIKSNKEFEIYGLRHLLKVIQTKSDQIIYNAKRGGIHQVKLIVKDGEIQAISNKKSSL